MVRAVPTRHSASLGELTESQHRSDPSDVGGEVLEDVPDFAIATRRGKDRPPSTVLTGVTEIGRRYQSLCLTRSVQGDPDPLAEALAAQLSKQEQSDHVVFAAIADQTHANQ